MGKKHSNGLSRYCTETLHLSKFKALRDHQTNLAELIRYVLDMEKIMMTSFFFFSFSTAVLLQDDN